MSTLEITLLAVIIGFGLVGLKAGLVQSIGSIIGLVIGTAVATRTFDDVGGFLLPLFGGNQIAAAVTSFIIIVLLVSRGVGILVYLADKAFGIIPGVNILNRLGGLLFGLIEGALLIGVIFSLSSRLPLSESTQSMIADSRLIQFTVTVSKWLLPLFPEALEKTKTIITG